LVAALALDVAGRTVARVSVEEHMANYQAARALKETLEILERAALLSILALVKARAQRRYPQRSRPSEQRRPAPKAAQPGGREADKQRASSLSRYSPLRGCASLAPCPPPVCLYARPTPVFQQSPRQGKLQKGSRARQQRKEGREEVRGEEGETKEVTRAIGDAAGLERVMREVIQMRSSVSKAPESICGKVTSALFAPSPVPSYLKITPQSRCVRDRSSAIYQIVR